ncbi:hypothetical protein METUNv1_00973 [Methyloversatilis universalis FAM5]|uniref:Uncharacterized protein n=1 Tax=Methyloversatilis universalis (strain ATCC BAA-1314 / DSM 25237 / JCM 13912 / CCUG 52030 / FAM5) TaxID=1000565 RepID=F5R9Q2_METUF|nr:hypothetical protein METUNv1_00973 [Methyloversatilis universalis FAM5]
MPTPAAHGIGANDRPAPDRRPRSRTTAPVALRPSRQGCRNFHRARAAGAHHCAPKYPKRACRRVFRMARDMQGRRATCARTGTTRR